MSSPRVSRSQKPVESRTAARYRIDELAQAAKTTVRNLRAYQERGLLAPPELDGRVGWYSEAHLARVRTITTMLERGYSLGNIAELLQAWQKGDDLGDLLGLEMAVTSPFESEPPASTSVVALARLFGTLDVRLLERAKEAGLVEQDEAGLSVPSPKLLEAGVALHRAGIPLSALLDELSTLRGELDVVAERFVGMVLRHVFDPHGKGLPPMAARAPLAETVWKVRPLAATVVQNVLTRALEHHMREALGARLSASIEPGTSPQGRRAESSSKTPRGSQRRGPTKKSSAR